METPLNNGKRPRSLTSPISLSLHKKTKNSETAAPVNNIPNPIITGSTSTSDTLPNTMNVKVKTPSRITDYFAAANKSPIGNTNVNTIEDLNMNNAMLSKILVMVQTLLTENKTLTCKVSQLEKTISEMKNTSGNKKSFAEVVAAGISHPKSQVSIKSATINASEEEARRSSVVIRHTEANDCDITDVDLTAKLAVECRVSQPVSVFVFVEIRKPHHC
uniref:Uncharacterized protein n=1 Tax=Caenorhabditis japonica TaxID=281687 RepID=A0A8R1E9U5_CAEJA